MEKILVYFDLETTGLSKWSDRIVQIGATVVLNNGNENITVMEFETFVNPDKKIHVSASAKTGIYDKDVVKAPSTKQALNDFFEKLKSVKTKYPNTPILMVAYNGIQFDFPILFCELIRNNMAVYLLMDNCGVVGFLDPLLWAKRELDTTCLIRRSNGSCSYKLSDVYIALTGTPLNNAHTALADTRGLKKICCHSKFGSMALSCELVPTTNYFLPTEYCIKSFMVKKKEFETGKNKNRKRNIRSLFECSRLCGSSPPNHTAGLEKKQRS